MYIGVDVCGCEVVRDGARAVEMMGLSLGAGVDQPAVDGVGDCCEWESVRGCEGCATGEDGWRR